MKNKDGEILKKKSTRHHYIPQFLTNKFSDDDANIWVYNKFTKKYFKTSAKNIFLENNRNVFKDANGNENSKIEEMYASLDSVLSSTLSKFIATEDINEKNVLDKLLFLAYLTKWRVPQYDESFEEAKRYFSADDLVKNINQVNYKFKENLEDLLISDSDQEIKRFLLPLQTFIYDKDMYKKNIQA